MNLFPLFSISNIFRRKSFKFADLFMKKNIWCWVSLCYAFRPFYDPHSLLQRILELWLFSYKKLFKLIQLFAQRIANSIIHLKCKGQHNYLSSSRVYHVYLLLDHPPTCENCIHSLTNTNTWSSLRGINVDCVFLSKIFVNIHVLLRKARAQRMREWVMETFYAHFLAPLAEKNSWKLFTVRSPADSLSLKSCFVVFGSKSLRFLQVSIMWAFQIQFALKLAKLRPTLMQLTVWIFFFVWKSFLFATLYSEERR